MAAPLEENVMNMCESVNSFFQLGGDDVRGTQMGLGRIIANGIANIHEDPSPEGQTLENVDELVASYRDLVSTDEVDLTAAR